MKRIQERANGWSDWQAPTMKRYRMGCCDCGLVHDLQFKVLRVKTRSKGAFTGDEVPGHRVMFRAKRNKRSTSQMRRKPQKCEASK